MENTKKRDLALPSLTMRHRIALAVGLMIFACSMLYRYAVHEAYGDLNWPFCAATMLRLQRDPYAVCVVGPGYPPNPLTTALAVLPFTFLPPAIAASFIFALAAGLLAYALTQTGYWRLGVFLSSPFWVAFQWMQWSPLLLATALLPSLLFLTLIKPQIGFPIVLTQWSWKPFLGCLLFGLLSLLVDPTWPARWWALAWREYTGFIPLLVLPGPLVLLALAKWRTEQARFLLLMAAVPQRGFYDPLLLFSIPRSRRQLLALTLCSWVGYGIAILGGLDIALLIVVSLYLPCLLIVLRAKENMVLHGETSL